MNRSRTDALCPVRLFRDQHVELQRGAAFLYGVIGDVDRGRADHATAGIFEVKVERVARAVIALEHLGVLRRPLARYRLREQAKDRLHELVTQPRAKGAPRSAEVRLDVLELGVSDDDGLQTNRVAHARNLIIYANCEQPSEALRRPYPTAVSSRPMSCA